MAWCQQLRVACMQSIPTGAERLFDFARAGAVRTNRDERTNHLQPRRCLRLTTAFSPGVARSYKARRLHLAQDGFKQAAVALQVPDKRRYRA